MAKDICSEALEIVQQIMGKFIHYSPFDLCEQLGISVITDKALRKDGYLISSDGLQLIFTSSNIQNKQRQEIIVGTEVGSSCIKISYTVVQMFLLLLLPR